MSRSWLGVERSRWIRTADASTDNPIENGSSSPSRWRLPRPWPMVARMRFRRGQTLPRVTRPSLAGDDLAERMRSTAFALLGIFTAMGLGLVALVSQQGWPHLPSSPIPGPSAKHGTLHEAIAVDSPEVPSADAASEPRAGRADRVAA